MLWIQVIERLLGHSDAATGYIIYDMQSVPRLSGLNLSCESAPDASPLLKLGRQLKHHRLTKRKFNAINPETTCPGLLLRGGTLIDATLLAATPSSK